MNLDNESLVENENGKPSKRRARDGVPAPEHRPLRILLAEDHCDTRHLVATALRGQGHEVVEVRDGISLLYHALFANRDVYDEPEVIISDVRLPDWSGVEILSLLRRVNANMPFVLITAYEDPVTADEAKKWHAAGVVPKPIDLDKLCVMVRTIAMSAD